MKVKLVWTAIISDVYQKHLVVAGRIGSDGKAELEVVESGWYIQVGSVSYSVGHEEPPFKKGDLVRFTVEKEEVNADDQDDADKSGRESGESAECSGE